MNMPINRRAFMGSAVATAFAAGLMKPRFAFAKDAFSGIDAVGQAALVREKKVTSLELVDAAIARIASANPKLNAVVAEYFDKARKQAQTALPASPLSGMPYLIKDLNDIKGEIATSGSRLMAKHIGTETSLLAQKAIDAGMIVVGKTNTPEFGLLASTESMLLGACHNPWNPAYSTGGSSGGAAAAVASGMLPVAHASDGGGSIRIPASCCGVFGMKPSRGRMNFGDKEKMPGDIAVENCVSRSVRDSAMVFSLCEDTSAHAQFTPTGFVHGPSKKRLKIAFSTLSYYGKEPHEDVKASVQATAKLCRGLGHEIIEVKNPVSGQEFVDAFLTVWASVPAQLVQLATSLKQKPQDVLEPWTIGLAEYFAKQPKDALAKSLAYFKKAEAATDAFMSQYDAWLTPVLSGTPPKLGEQAPTVPFDTLYERVTSYVAYTPIHNVAGTPAMSVPLGWSKTGLPIGSQFAAAKGNEALLYALAYELEQANGWAGKHAAVWAD
ncbi:MAG TPA: amidase [Steroidobacteraceae bacterium]|jgi:amidase|nr:amidase [Steroidobacteraceae bacterium]